jgi:hypothetical protein
VLMVGRQASKRAYRTIRIPRPVYERVIRKLSVQLRMSVGVIAICRGTSQLLRNRILFKSDLSLR